MAVGIQLGVVGMASVVSSGHTGGTGGGPYPALGPIAIAALAGSLAILVALLAIDAPGRLRGVVER